MGTPIACHHDRLAPGLVEGLYLLGSLAFDDWSPRSDIDVVAFTSEPATDTDVERLLLATRPHAPTSTWTSTARTSRGVT